MDVQVLREFTTLARELNYSVAAEKLFISRSSLSKHISALEKELGSQLFERDSHSVKLTLAGADLAERMETIIGLYDDALASLDAISKHGTSALRLGYLFQTAGSFLPSACAAFMKTHDTRLILRAMEVQEIREGIIRDELDIGLTSCVLRELSDEYSYEVLAHDSYGVIVPSFSPLAHLSSAAAADLHGMTLYGPNPQYLPTEAKIFSRYFESSRDCINMRMSINDFGSLLPVLAMGADAVFTVGHAQKILGENFTFLPFADLEADPCIAVLWRKLKESEELLAFVACIKESFEHTSGLYFSELS